MRTRQTAKNFRFKNGRRVNRQIKYEAREIEKCGQDQPKKQATCWRCGFRSSWYEYDAWECR